MRHWARVFSLALVMSACQGEVTETPPSPAPSAAEAIAEPVAGPDSLEPKPEPRAGGLAGITREVIDQAKQTETEPLRLVPDLAHFVVRVRPSQLLAHTEVRALWSKTEKAEPRLSSMLDSLRACGTAPETIDELVIGHDDDESGMMVVHAKGLGTEATWRCLDEESTSRGRALELTFTGTARGEGPQLRRSEGNVGYFLDDDAVVLVSKAWAEPVRERLRGAGTAAIEGSLASVAGRIRPEDSAWVVGRITGQSASSLVGTPMAGIVDMTLDLRVSGGDLVFATTADAGERADATRIRDELQRQFEQFETVLPMLGLPSTVAPKIEFVSEGDLVSLGFTLTEDELRGLREFIERM